MTDPYLEVVSQSHIAIVDDDAAACLTLLRLFRSRGFTAAAYQSAEAFLMLGGHDDVACLVINLTMPRMGGLDLQNHLAAMGHRPPIIFLTAVDDLVLRRAALSQGAVCVLNKPPNEHELLEAVHAALLQKVSGCTDVGVALTTRRMMH